MWIGIVALAVLFGGFGLLRRGREDCGGGGCGACQGGCEAARGEQR